MHDVSLCFLFDCYIVLIIWSSGVNHSPGHDYLRGVISVRTETFPIRAYFVHSPLLGGRRIDPPLSGVRRLN